MHCPRRRQPPGRLGGWLRSLEDEVRRRLRLREHGHRDPRILPHRVDPVGKHRDLGGVTQRRPTVAAVLSSARPGHRRSNGSVANAAAGDSRPGRGRRAPNRTVGGRWRRIRTVRSGEVGAITGGRRFDGIRQALTRLIPPHEPRRQVSRAGNWQQRRRVYQTPQQRGLPPRMRSADTSNPLLSSMGRSRGSRSLSASSPIRGLPNSAGSSRMLIGVGLRRRSARQAIDTIKIAGVPL